MSTESFSKNFSFTSKASVDAFVKELEHPSPKRKIRRNLVSEEDRKRGEEKLRRMFSH